MASTTTAKNVKSSSSWDKLLETASWQYQQVSKWQQNHERLLQRLEATYLDYEVDPEAEPINILCFDGGGMKGYALCAVLSVIEEKYGGGKGGTDILEYFDLVAGTSIGGAFAAMCNVMKNLRGAIDETVDGADDIRERTFGNFNVGELLKTGSLVPKKDQIDAIVKERWGEHKLFFNPSGPPAMVLCALKHDCFTISEDDDGEETKMFEFEPFVFRTYEYPSKNTNDDDVTAPSSDDSPMFKSSSSVKMYEAVTATTAVPLVVNRVNIQVNGKVTSLADGCLFGDCPVVVAIEEARRLYPRRPIGVILSIGVNRDKEKTLIEQAINTAKVVHPQLHFQRIVPHDICAKFSLTETDLDKVATMEEQVREFVRHDEKVVIELDETMKKLSNQRRSRPRFIVEEGSIEQSRRDMMLRSNRYQERSQHRNKVADGRSIVAVTSSLSEKTKDMDTDITSFDEDDNMSLETVSSTDAVILAAIESSRDNAMTMAIDKEISTLHGCVQESYEEIINIGDVVDDAKDGGLPPVVAANPGGMVICNENESNESTTISSSTSGDGWMLLTKCLSCFRKDPDKQHHVKESEYFRTTSVRTNSTHRSESIRSDEMNETG